jgi:hypothetical protein
MTKHNVVAINAGEIIGVEEYDPINDGKRNNRKQAAADAIAERINIPRVSFGVRGTKGENGVEWGTMTGNLQVGMVEIGWGKWGFRK